LTYDKHIGNICWGSIGIQWNMSLHVSDRILSARNNFVSPCFMEVLACATWNIWKVRNEWIFQGVVVSLNCWKVKFQNDLLLHQYGVKATLVQDLIDRLLLFLV
jgi:hypothetical protein